MNLTWMLPEHISDVLPHEAQIIETMRRKILDELSRHGYEYVIPPLIEYTNTLNLGTQEDLAKKIFKWLDTHSQKMLGVRADITPQIARIDAHMINSENTTRFSYCDSVLHSRTRAYDTRQPIQIGAEIYGTADLRAEIEILSLMLKSLKIIGLDKLNRAITLSISHAGLLPALGIHINSTNNNTVNDNKTENYTTNGNYNYTQELYQAIKHKNYAFLEQIDHQHQHQIFLLKLLRQHSTQKVLQLLNDYASQHQLADLQKVADDFAALTNSFAHIQENLAFDVPLHFFVDVSDVESYQYHTGLEFSFYLEDYAYAIAKGGRYDAMSQAFGKNRPACGFSMNLRQLSNLYLKSNELNCQSDQKPLIIAPWLLNTTNDSKQLNAYIENLRKNITVLVMDLGDDIAVNKFKACEEKLQKLAIEFDPHDDNQSQIDHLELQLNDAVKIYHLNFDSETKSIHSSIDMVELLQSLGMLNNHLQSFKIQGVLGFTGLYLFKPIK